MVSFYVSTATFFLLHCDEWDRVVALPRHKFVTGATSLQLEVCHPPQFSVHLKSMPPPPLFPLTCPALKLPHHNHTSSGPLHVYIDDYQVFCILHSSVNHIIQGLIYNQFSLKNDPPPPPPHFLENYFAEVKIKKLKTITNYF